MNAETIKKQYEGEISMEKAIVAVLMVVLLSSGLLAGRIGGVGGSGNLETKEFDFSDFTCIKTGYAFEAAC